MASRYSNSNLCFSDFSIGDGELENFEQSLLQSLTDEDKIDLLPILRFTFPSLRHTLPKQQLLQEQQCINHGSAYISGMPSTTSRFTNVASAAYLQNTGWMHRFWNPFTDDNTVYGMSGIWQGACKDYLSEFLRNGEAALLPPSVSPASANVLAKTVNQICSSPQFHGTGTFSHSVDGSLGFKGFNAGGQQIITTHGSALPVEDQTGGIHFSSNMQVPQLRDHEDEAAYVDDKNDTVFKVRSECAGQDKNNVHISGVCGNLQNIGDYSKLQNIEDNDTHRVNDMCNSVIYSNDIKQNGFPDHVNIIHVDEAFRNSKNIEGCVPVDAHVHAVCGSLQNIEDHVTTNIHVGGKSENIDPSACDTDEYGSDADGCLDYRHNDAEMPRSSDLSSWDNDCETPGDINLDSLQFPKANRRRRKINRKGGGWVKKRMATLKFSSRMRHKRKCNLPCCTDSESGVKKRKLSECIDRNADSKSEDTHVRFPPHLSTKIVEDKPEHGSDPQCVMDKYFNMFASDVDENSACQAAEGWLSSPLRTALIIVLLESGDRGASVSEIVGMLDIKGYSKVFGLENQLLIEQIKSTLSECPDFKELRTHRFILEDCSHFWSKKKSMINALLHLQNATQEHAEDVNGGSEFSESELDKLQDFSSQEVVNNFSANSSSETKFTPPEKEVQLCRKTDGRQWRCPRAAMVGFAYCARHQQPRRKAKTNRHVYRKYSSSLSYREGLCVPKEEEKSDTGVGSCSDQSLEQDSEEVAQQHRCCRTDGKNWQCVNRAINGTMYCKHHENQMKKVVVRKNTRETITVQAKQSDWPSGDSVISNMYSTPMKLRSRPRR